MFDSRFFQDSIIQHAGDNLFSRYIFLRRQFYEAITDLSNSAPGIEKSQNRIRDGLKWIFNNPKRRPGQNLSNETWATRKKLVEFGKVIYELKNTKQSKYITDKDLIEAGFDESVYNAILEKVLIFIAWAYSIQIYEQITKMFNAPGSKVDFLPQIPEKELSRLSIDSLVKNPTPRIPVMFIVDNGLYMDQNGCLSKLDMGLTELIEEVRSNSTLSHQLELYISTTGNGPKEIVNFNTIDHLEIELDNFMILPFGRCKMASTIELALRRLDERIQQMKDPDINVDILNCPWMIVLSNGKFAEDMTAISKELQERISHQKLMVYWRAVSQNAHMEVLSQMPAQESGKAKVLENINGFFKDINHSLQTASCSIPGRDVELQNKSGFVE